MGKMKKIKPKEDEILIKRAQNNPRAYEALYKKYAKRVYDYFWFRAGRVKEVAEDLAQETFVKAYQKLPSFRLRAYSYFSYLLTIAHNTLVKYYKKPKTASIEELGDVAESAPGDTLEKRLAEKEMSELLWRAVGSMPEKEILLLKYRDGLKVKDIARFTGKSENAVKLALSRARKKLAQLPELRGF